jgi:hypothetical protein
MTDETEIQQIVIEPLTHDRNEGDSDEADSKPSDCLQSEQTDESEQTEPTVRLDKRGRKISQKRLDAIKVVREKALRNRKENTEKARLYDQMQKSRVDYDVLSRSLCEQVVEKLESRIRSQADPSEVKGASPSDSASTSNKKQKPEYPSYRAPRGHIIF